MSRMIHFGVVATDGLQAGTPGFTEHVTRWLGGTPYAVDGSSFTDWSEPFPQGAGDALHVSLYVGTGKHDEDADRIRLSPEEVREIADDLAERLPGSSFRVVDYWLEDDGEEWGSDVHIHGPWALESISGRAL